MKHFLYFISIIGLVQILMYGKVFDKIRPEWEVLKCSLCTGFHVSLFYYLLFHLLSPLNDNFIIGLMTYPFGGAYISYIFDRMIDDDGIRIKVSKRGERY